MWTPSQDTELNRLWESNSASEIAKALGTTRNAVIGRYHRIHGTYSEQIKKAAEAEKAETAKVRAAAKAAEALVIAETKRRVSGGTGRDEAICFARKRGATLQAIGECFGVTRERVRQIEVEQQKESVSQSRESG